LPRSSGSILVHGASADCGQMSTIAGWVRGFGRGIDRHGFAW
jgi:hypothetical protein